MQDALEILIQYIRSAWRFRWWALGTAWLLSVAGWIVVAIVPDVYQAETRVYVDPSSDLRLLLDDQIVQSNVDDQLQFVRQSLLGTVQLERLVRETGMVDDVEGEMEMRRLVAALRANISIAMEGDAARGRRGEAGGVTYTLAYQDSDRQLSKTVVEKLLSIFIDDTLGAKQTSSAAANTFLRNQIQEYEERLKEAETRLAEFNRQHYDRLPSMQGGYFQQLQSATSEFDESRQALRVAQSRLERIDQQIRGEAPRSDAGRDVDPNSLQGRIRDNQRTLDELQQRFTDNHPDVKATKEILAGLKEQRQRELERLEESGGYRGSSDDPVIQALYISKNEVEAEVATLQEEVRDRERRVERLRGLINEMPEVEAQQAQLNRDYDVINAHYQSLLNSLERERLSRDVFQSEQIEFRVIDPPSVSMDPVAPPRELLHIAVLMMGFGGGAGLAFLMGQLRPVFPAPQQLQAYVEVPVIGSIGRFWSTEERRRRTWGYGAFMGGAAALVITGGLVLLLQQLQAG